MNKMTLDPVIVMFKPDSNNTNHSFDLNYLRITDAQSIGFFVAESANRKTRL